MAALSLSQPKYFLILLAVMQSFNFVDRVALGILLQNIKADLLLSDTQLGTLTGIAFAIFYAGMGLPIARLADRGNRVSLIAVCTMLASVMVSLCGLAANFIQLLFLRVVVGVGEAGLVPPAHSLIADRYSHPERPRATTIFMTGIPLSSLLGYFGAGWINQLLGWRVTFMLLGLPGLALAVLAAVKLKEPRDCGMWGYRNHDEMSAASTAEPIWKVLQSLWRLRSYRHLVACFTLVSFFAVGMNQWMPSFFIRSFHIQTGELGTWLTVIYGVVGTAGTFYGGALISRLGKGNDPLLLTMLGGCEIVFGIFWAMGCAATHEFLSFLFIAMAVFVGGFISGPIFALIQSLIAPRMRATAIATILLISNSIGLGLGPLAVGILSDGLRHFYGDQSLRYALLAFSPGLAWAGVHLLVARRYIQSDLKMAEAT